MNHMDISMLYLAVFISLTGMSLGMLAVIASVVAWNQFRDSAIKLLIVGAVAIAAGSFLLTLAGSAIQIRTAMGG